MTVDAGPFHPSHSITIFLANISPNPSMTPLTNGNKRFTARDEANANALVRVDKEESKMDSVTETGPLCAGGSAGGAGAGAGGVSNERDGKDEAMEGTSSHFWSSSVVDSSCEGFCWGLCPADTNCRIGQRKLERTKVDFYISSGAKNL